MCATLSLGVSLSRDNLFVSAEFHRQAVDAGLPTESSVEGSGSSPEARFEHRGRPVQSPESAVAGNTRQSQNATVRPNVTSLHKDRRVWIPSAIFLWKINSTQHYAASVLKCVALRENNFSLKKVAVGLKLFMCVETSYLNIIACKCESSQKDES